MALEIKEKMAAPVYIETPEKLTLELKQEIIAKANLWDELKEEIGKFCDTPDSKGNLSDIGEIAAIKLGYL